uniref:Uncharacterized protein n=1 Tax=Kwoniella dejecticola CBS 10117 TaxID=1296121 RepID=A0A1A6A3V9_9TREE|nr:uncharacterized protein I303_05595 [Kwoniella dejecticola CBS 10117]OBR84736.1 hypothetical protein I303_05595 [Kwoniella dejecticola CBS 10117]
MSKVVGQVLVVVAILALVHAAFSTYERMSFHTLTSSSDHNQLIDERCVIDDYWVTDLSTLKALSRPTTSLPTSIIVEALISLGLFIPGIALSSDSLEDVTYRGELAKRSIDDQDARMGFMIPSKRGRAIFGDRP